MMLMMFSTVLFDVSIDRERERERDRKGGKERETGNSFFEGRQVVLEGWHGWD